jgi:site-specific DNA-cytosine methylase
MEKIKFIDLFCGIGGFRTAMDQACIENDLIPECVFHRTLTNIAKTAMKPTLDTDHRRHYKS